MNSSKGFLISLLFLVSGELWAQGSAWKEIDGQGKWGLRVDEASLVQLSDDEQSVGVTWRTTLDGKTTETMSQVACAYFQIVNVSASVVNASASSQPPSASQGPANIEHPVKYGYYGTLEGAVIDHVCSRMRPDTLARLQEPSVDCNKEPSKSPLICPGSPALNANALLFTLRSRDLVPLCHEQEKRATALHDDIYFQAFDCKDQLCAQDAIRYGLQVVSSDLEGVRAAEMAHSEKPFKCTAVSSLSDRITERLQLDAMTQYRECLRENLPNVSQKLTDPAAVARSAHSMCLALFSKATAEFGNQWSDAEYYARQEPNLVKWVSRRLSEVRKTK